MQRNIAEVANETREVALFDFWGGGQRPVTCERCDICTVTGEGTSFWNTVRHSFTINLVLAVFLREVPIRTYVMSNTTNQFVTSEGKRSIQYHSIYVAACAVRPEQVQHAEWTSPQSSESTTDN